MSASTISSPILHSINDTKSLLNSKAVAGMNMQAKRNPMGSGSSITEFTRHNRNKGKRSCLTETL